jgi:hypothetical protein
VGNWVRPVPPRSRWCCGCRVAGNTEAIANTNQGPISRSKGTRRRIDRPSGFQSRRIWPPTCFTIASESTLSNPSLCGFPSRCGPPRSLHTRINSPSARITPEVRTILLPGRSRRQPEIVPATEPTGVPGTSAIGGAIDNAVSAAIGTRLRKLIAASTFEPSYQRLWSRPARGRLLRRPRPQSAPRVSDRQLHRWESLAVGGLVHSAAAKYCRQMRVWLKL